MATLYLAQLLPRTKPKAVLAQHALSEFVEELDEILSEYEDTELNLAMLQGKVAYHARLRRPKDMCVIKYFIPLLIHALR
eukprot:45660-Amphidinium_carterae.1